MAAWRAFMRATSQITRVLETELQAEHGLSLTGYGLLVMLSEAPGGALRMSTVADEFGLTRSAITRLVDRLERDGLVERTSCPSDARGSFARLTDRGMETLRQAYPTHLSGVRRHIFDRLDDDGVAALASALGTLSEACSAARAARAGALAGPDADCR